MKFLYRERSRSRCAELGKFCVDMELSDEFIPYGDKKFVFKKLLKLPLPVLGHLVMHWASKYGTDSGQHVGNLESIIENLQKRKVKRNVLASRILLEYWPKGLYLYQLAQIDCYLLVHRPSIFYWISSSITNANNESQVVHLRLDSFIKSLKEDLQKFYLCNIHSFRHPTLQLVILRIQLFDYSNIFQQKSSLNIRSDAPLERQLVSRSPYYVAFPSNSSNIVHSPDEDSYSNLILQSVQKVLSQREPVLLRLNERRAIKSLETMQILRGASRYTNALGPWSCYADTSFEVSPLGLIESHQAIKGKRVLNPDDSYNDESTPEVKRLRFEKTMLRFKGSKKGVRAKKVYALKKLSDRIHNPDKSVSSYAEKQTTVSQYASLVPVEKTEFTLKNQVPESTDQVVIKFRFRGNDIFGGLHELCDKQLIDIDKVPGWLAGENGVESGTIDEGMFTRDTNRGGLL